MAYGLIKVSMLVLLVTGCNASPPVNNETTVPQKSGATEIAGTSVPVKKDTKVSELNLFVGDGATILASQHGDLNGDGVQDVVLVLDYSKGSDHQLGEGVHRSLLLLIRDDAGQLRKARQNDAIVPCAKCGGIAGDPFGYVRVAEGAFTVLIEGGSRERWSDEYVFRYSAEEQDWLLDKAIHGVTDTITGEAELTELTRKDFGVIRFEEFDPSMLPSVDGA